MKTSSFKEVIRLTIQRFNDNNHKRHVEAKEKVACQTFQAGSVIL